MSGSLDVFHHHIFKCAGSTFSWILEKNFPRRVAYVEKRDPGARLDCEDAAEQAELADARAVTSHLATVPDEGRSLATLHVTFVRKPEERLASAYAYQRRIGAPAAEERSFRDYLERQRHSVISNFQTRHLSPQDDWAWAFSAGWHPAPERIRLDRNDLFVGTVESFDRCMVLLESRMASRGLAFDASYPGPQNSVSGEGRSWSVPFRDMLELDESLYRRVAGSVEAAWNSLDDAEERLRDFQARCVREKANPTRAVVRPPALWSYLD